MSAARIKAARRHVQRVGIRLCLTEGGGDVNERGNQKPETRNQKKIRRKKNRKGLPSGFGIRIFFELLVSGFGFPRPPWRYFDLSIAAAAVAAVSICATISTPIVCSATRF